MSTDAITRARWVVLRTGAAAAMVAAAACAQQSSPAFPHSVHPLPAQMTNAEPLQPLPPTDSNPAPYLQAILGQLVVMNNDLRRSLDRALVKPRACDYGDKSYTEGALLKVEGVTLVCVPVSISEGEVATVHYGATGEKASEPAGGVDGETQKKRFVWEPLMSPRLAEYRKQTGLEGGKR
jgi:hypothetical protein